MNFNCAVHLDGRINQEGVILIFLIIYNVLYALSKYSDAGSIFQKRWGSGRYACKLWKIKVPPLKNYEIHFSV